MAKVTRTTGSSGVTANFYESSGVTREEYEKAKGLPSVPKQNNVETLSQATQKAQKEYDDYINSSEARIYQKNYGKPSEKANEIQKKLNEARLAERDAKNEANIERLVGIASQYQDDKTKKSKADIARAETLSEGVRAKEGDYAWKSDTYKAMEADELEIYNRLAKNGKEKEAEEFLEALTPTLNARVTEGRINQSTSASGGVVGGISASAASSLLKPVSAVQGGLKTLIDFKQGKAIDAYAPEYYASNLSNALRTDVAQRIEQGVYESTIGDYTYDRKGNRVMTTEGEAKNNGKIASFLYMTGMSMADMYVMMPFGMIGNKAMGMKVLMSSNAGVDTMLEAKKIGATDEEALKLGVVAGVAEQMFEKYSIDNLLSGNISASTLGSMAKQFGTEGSEEIFTEVANIIANETIMGSKSDFNKAVAAYMEAGASLEDAKKEALKETLLRIGQAGLAGALMGGVMGGVADVYRTSAAGQNAIDTYLDSQFALSERNANYQEKATQELRDRYLEIGMTKEEADAALKDDVADIKKRATELRDEARASFMSDPNRRASAEIELTQAYREDAEGRGGVAGKVAKREGSLGRQVMANTDADIDAATNEVKAKMEKEGLSPLDISKRSKKYKEDLRRMADNAQHAKTPAERKFWTEKYNSMLKATEVSETDVAEIEEAIKEPSKAEKKVKLFESRIETETAKLNAMKNKNSYEAMQQKDKIRKLRKELNGWKAIAEFKGVRDASPVFIPQNNVTEQYESATEQAKKIKEDIFNLRKQMAKAANPKMKAQIKAEIDKLLEQTKDARIKTGITAPLAGMPAAKQQESGYGIVRDFSRPLNSDQAKSISILDSFGKSIGRTIHVVDSLSADGKDELNGAFNRKTDEYYIALENMDKSLGYVAVHESIHDIAKNARVSYEKLRDTVIDELEKHGYNTTNMIVDRMDEYGESEEVAIEEVIANTVPAILRDAETADALVDRILEGDAETKSAFRNFLDSLKSYFDMAFNALKGASAWRQMDAIAKDKEAVDRIRERYLEGLEAIKNRSESDMDTLADAVGVSAERVTDADGNALAVSDGNNLLFSLYTYENGGRDLLGKTLKENGFSEADTETAFKQMDSIANFLKDYDQRKNYGRLRENLYAEPTLGILRDKSGERRVMLHTLIPNGDYPVNLEMSTNCKKREPYQQVINNLIDTGVFGRVKFNDEAIARVREILQDYGYETACAVCFVEAKRTQLQKFAEDICNEWNELVDERVKNADSFDFAKGKAKLTEAELFEYENLFRTGKKNAVGNTNLGVGSPKAKMGRIMDKYPQLRKKLSAGDIATPQGMRELRKLMPDLFSIIRSRYGAGTLKFIQSSEAYNGDAALLTFKYLKDEIGKPLPGKKQYIDAAGGDETVALRNYLLDIGGARSQSFSDALIENVFDKLQLYADMAAKKFSMQEYTKEISTARLFGMTGVKQNLSVIHLIDPTLGTENAGLMMVDGKLTYVAGDYEQHNKTGSHIQSVGWKDAVALQNDPRYSANVGIIAIGFSDKHIKMMLDDANIRMIIPYHKSGLPHGFAEIAKVYAAKNYEEYQTTTINKLYDVDGNEVEIPDKLDKKFIVDTEFMFNKAVQEAGGDARAAAEAYKAWCAEKHPVYTKGKSKRIAYYATYTPKFSIDGIVNHPNYYKLLEDFNTYDAITEAPASQGAVTMNYPSQENALTSTQIEQYKQRLRNTGIFTEAEIEKYSAIAQMDMETLIKREMSSRQDYNEKQDAVFGTMMEEINSMLMRDYPRDSDIRASYNTSVTSAQPAPTSFNARDLRPVEASTEPANVRITAKGRNEWEQAQIDEFNKTQTPAPQRKSYSIEKLPASVVQALRDERRIKREYNTIKENTSLTPEQMDTIETFYKGHFSLDETVQLTRNRYTSLNPATVADYYNAFSSYTENQQAVNKYKREHKAELLDTAVDLTEHAIDWKDKPTGIQYARETMERNNRDIMSEAEAEAINAEYFTPVHENEANNKRWQRDYAKRMRDLKLNKWESKYVHALINEKDLVENRMGSIGADEALKYTRDAMQKLTKSHGQLIDVKKCRNAVPEVLKLFRDIYGDLTDAEIRNGYAATEFYNTYAPNISDDSNLGFFEKIAQSLGFEQGDMRLPTDLAGLTAGFKPGKPWFQYSLSRHNHMTAFDIHKAFDQYIQGAGNVVWHTDDIQRLRALETAIRYQFSDEGIRQKIRDILQDATLDPDEAHERIQRIAGSNKNLGNYVSNLTEYTNLLAGKKSIHDRGTESDFGRAMYRVMNNIQGRVAGNVIGGNISVALSNIIPLTQALSGVRADSLAAAMLEAGGAFGKDDGFNSSSTFLTNRQKDNPLYRSGIDKVNDVISVPFNTLDLWVTSTLVRARYSENVERGMSQDEAMTNADAWAASLMADRSKGALPTIFGRTNPIAKLFNMFQVEVNNQLSYMVKDIAHDVRQTHPGADSSKVATFVAGKLLAMFIAAFAYNKLREEIGLIGNAFDPISYITNMYGEVEKYKEEEITQQELIETVRKETADQIPFVGSLLGGEGRYSVVQSALPDVWKIAQAHQDDQRNEAGGAYFKSVLKKEMEKPLFYYLLPTMGGQIKKTRDGLITVAQGGSETVNRYGETVLQYPVERTLGNYVKAGLLGKSTLPEAQAWVESGFQSLTPKQTELYREYESAGGDTMDFVTYQKRYEELTSEISRTNKELREKADEIAAANPMLTDAEAEERAKQILGRDFRNAENELLAEIQGSSMTDLQKLAAISAIGLSDEEIDTVRGLLDNGIAVSDYLKYDNFYRERGDTKTEDKQALITVLWRDNNLSANQKTMLANKLIDGDWIVDFSSEAAYKLANEHGKTAYNKWKTAEAEYGVSAEDYLKIAEAGEVKGDKDANGDSISGSKKAKVANLLESLNASKEYKQYLWKNVYGYESDIWGGTQLYSIKKVDGVWQPD